MTATKIFSTAYFPPLDYMASLIKFEAARIEIYETYPKQTYRNRCVIYTANGIQNLSVPVIKVDGNHTKIKDVRVDNIRNMKWQNVHWRAIASAYRKAPYFEHYQSYLEPIFDKSLASSLIKLNMYILHTVLKLLKSEIDLKLTGSYNKYPSSGTDLRNAFLPKLFVSGISFPPYHQVFMDRHGFIPNLSILDLLFCEGPHALDYLHLLADLIPDTQS